MEEELDRHFKRREELHKKMESTKALISQSVFDERVRTYIVCLPSETHNTVESHYCEA